MNQRLSPDDPRFQDLITGGEVVLFAADVCSKQYRDGVRTDDEGKTFYLAPNKAWTMQKVNFWVFCRQWGRVRAKRDGHRAFIVRVPSADAEAARKFMELVSFAMVKPIVHEHDVAWASDPTRVFFGENVNLPEITTFRSDQCERASTYPPTRTSRLRRLLTLT